MTNITFPVDFDPHTEEYETDEPDTDWPGIGLDPDGIGYSYGALTVQPGDWILANLGTEYVYTLSDDQTGSPIASITFGAINNQDGTGFTYAPTQGASISVPPATPTGIIAAPYTVLPTDFAETKLTFPIIVGGTSYGAGPPPATSQLPVTYTSTNTGSYSGPYANIPASKVFDLGNDLVEYGIEVIATVDSQPDVNGKFRIHFRSGTSETTANDYGDSSVTRNHLAQHHQTKQNWHGVIFEPRLSQITSGSTSCKINWSSGSFSTHDGQANQPITAPTDQVALTDALSAHAEDYIVYNHGVNSITTYSYQITNGKADRTKPSPGVTINAGKFGAISTVISGVPYVVDFGADENHWLTVVGKVSQTIYANTAAKPGEGDPGGDRYNNYWLTGWQHGSHKISKNHLAFPLSSPGTGQTYYTANHPGDFTIYGIGGSIHVDTTGLTNVTMDWNPGGFLDWVDSTETRQSLGINNPTTVVNGKTVAYMTVNHDDLLAYNSNSTGTTATIPFHQLGPVRSPTNSAIPWRPGATPTGDGPLDLGLFLIGRVSDTVCATNNKLFIYGFHVGLHQHGCHQLQDGSIGREKEHAHSKFHLHGVIMRIAPGVEKTYKNTNIPPAAASANSIANVPVSWDIGGIVTVNDGTTPPGWTGPTMAILNTSITSFNVGGGINAGDYIVFASASGTFGSNTFVAGNIYSVNSSQIFDVTMFIIGRVSPTPDKRTGLLYIQGWHVGLHQTHGDLLGYGAVLRDKMSSHNVGKFHIHNVTMKVGNLNPTLPPLTSSYNQTSLVPVGWTSGGTVSLDDANSGHVDGINPYTIANTSMTINATDWIAFNSSPTATINGILPNYIGSISQSSLPLAGGYFDDRLYIIGRVTPVVDKHSKLLRISGFNVGLHQVGGEQIHDGSMDRYHLKDHHQHNWHVHNVILKNSTTGLPNVTNTWTWTGSGYITTHVGQNVNNPGAYPIRNNSFTGQAGQWITYNSCLSSDQSNGAVNGQLNGIAYQSIGTLSSVPSTGSYLDSRLYLIGRIAATPDRHSKMLQIHGFHVGLHQTGGEQHHSGSHSRVHGKKHKAGKGHPNGFVTSTSSTSGNTAQLTWTPGYYLFDDGTIINMVTAAQSGSGRSLNEFSSGGTVTAGDILLFYVEGGNNSSASLVNVPIGTDLTQATYDDYLVIGRISRSVDPITNQYYVVGHHVNAHKAHGAHHSDHSHHRRHSHSSHHHKSHFTDVIFSIIGNTLYINGPPALSGYYITDSSGGAVYVTGGSIPIAAGNTILFDTSNPGSGAFRAVANYNVDALGDQYMKVGHISNYVDANTGQLVFHGYHHGSHEVHGKHVKASAISGGISGNSTDHIKAGEMHRRHHHVNNTHRHHPTNIVYTTSNGSNCTVSWTTGQFMDDTNGLIGNVSASSISGVFGNQWIIYNTANGIHSAVNSLDTTFGNDKYIVVGRVSADLDTNTGQYWIHGHHTNSHAHHGIHIMPSTVDSSKANVAPTGGFSFPAFGIPMSLTGAGTWNGPYPITLPWKTLSSDNSVYASISGLDGYGSTVLVRVYSYTPNVAISANNPDPTPYAINSVNFSVNGVQLIITGVQVNADNTATITYWYQNRNASTGYNALIIFTFNGAVT